MTKITIPYSETARQAEPKDMVALRPNRALPVWTVLGSVWAAHVAVNWYWLRLDRVPLVYDAHKHYLLSLSIARELSQPSLQMWGQMLTAADRHPFLVQLTTAPLQLLFGTTPDVAVMLNAGIFLGILLWGTHGLTTQLLGHREGLLAACIVSLYPGIFNSLRGYMLDLPLTAIVAANLYLLIRTEGFTCRRMVVWWALTLAAGLLIKMNVVAFVLPPAGYVCWRQRHQTGRRRVVLWAVGGVVIALLTVWIAFYEPKMAVAFRQFRDVPLGLLAPTRLQGWDHFVTRVGMISHGLWTASWLYLVLVANNLTSWWMFAGVIGGCWLWSARDRRGWIFWALVPAWLLAALLQSPDRTEAEWIHVRYLLPLLPTLAMMTSHVLWRLSQPYWRRAVVGVVVCAGAAQMAWTSFGPSEMPSAMTQRYVIRQRHLQLPLRLVAGPMPIPSLHISRPVQADWETPLHELLSMISNDRQRAATQVTFLHDVGELWGPMQLLQAEGQLDHVDLRCDSLALYYWQRVPLDELILQADYVLRAEDPILKSSSAPVEELAMQYFEQHSHRFELHGRIAMPDNQRLLVYRRRAYVALNT